MECIPAIDLRGGRSVRLLRGDYAVETVYGDPLEHARGYVEKGASRLHVVDLDAARSGVAGNEAVIAAIASAVDVPIEVGGGVRSVARAAQLLDVGVDRVVVGTAAVEDPSLLEELTRMFPGQIAVGLDHRNAIVDGRLRREVAVRGWEVGSGVELEEELARVAELALAAVIVTDISRDGTLEGPDVEGLVATLSATKHPVIASGGVGSAKDLMSLGALVASGRRIAGVIVGRALLSGAVTLEEALSACRV